MRRGCEQAAEVGPDAVNVVNVAAVSATRRRVLLQSSTPDLNVRSC